MTLSDSGTLERFDTLPTTMDVARDALMSGRLRYDREGRLPYRAVIASEQTAGRGQRGRTWYAPPGESLCATYYYRQGPIEPQTAGRIALLAGVAAAEAVRHVCAAPLSPPTLGLKWPNDLLLNGRKLGGILVELVNVPDTGWVALIGVGINVLVTDFPPELSEKATSLRREGFPGISCAQLGERLADTLDALAGGQDEARFPEILRCWRAYDLSSGRRYEALLPSGPQPGVAEGIDESGALLLRMDDGSLQAVTSASALRPLGP